MFEDKRFYDHGYGNIGTGNIPSFKWLCLIKYSIATTDITPVGLNLKAGKAYSKAQFDNIKIYTVKISDE